MPEDKNPYGSPGVDALPESRRNWRLWVGWCLVAAVAVISLFPVLYLAAMLLSQNQLFWYQEGSFEIQLVGVSSGVKPRTQALLLVGITTLLTIGIALIASGYKGHRRRESVTARAAPASVVAPVAMCRVPFRSPSRVPPDATRAEGGRAGASL